MTAVSICQALSNAARSADTCASMCREQKKEAAAVAQSRLASEMWKLAGWWADNTIPLPTADEKGDAK